MDVRNSLEGLKSLLGVNPPAPAATGAKSSTAGRNECAGQRPRNLEQCRERSIADGRRGWCAHGQGVCCAGCLAAGTYDVPSWCCLKVVDSMLGGEK